MTEVRLREWITQVLAAHTECRITDCPACSHTVDILTASSNLNRRVE